MDIILPFTDYMFSILLSFALKLFNIGIDITYLILFSVDIWNYVLFPN